MSAYRDEDDWEDEAADFGDDAEDEPTVPCPFCRREVLEDAPWCPHCEEYISAADHARPTKPLWVTVTAMVCLAVAAWWVSGRGYAPPSDTPRELFPNSLMSPGTRTGKGSLPVWLTPWLDQRWGQAQRVNP